MYVGEPPVYYVQNVPYGRPCRRGYDTDPPWQQGSLFCVLQRKVPLPQVSSSVSRTPTAGRPDPWAASLPQRVDRIRVFHTVTWPYTSTSNPFSGVNLNRLSLPLEGNGINWLAASFSVKYTWPDAARRRFEISPATQTNPICSSSRFLILRVNCATEYMGDFDSMRGIVSKTACGLRAVKRFEFWNNPQNTGILIRIRFESSAIRLSCSRAGSPAGGKERAILNQECA